MPLWLKNAVTDQCQYNIVPYNTKYICFDYRGGGGGIGFFLGGSNKKNDIVFTIFR